MLNIGDVVKVIGTTLCGAEEIECIPIGTICHVVNMQQYDEACLTVGIVPENDLPYKGNGEYWYNEKDLEKGCMQWIPDAENLENDTCKINADEFRKTVIEIQNLRKEICRVRKNFEIKSIKTFGGSYNAIPWMLENALRGENSFLLEFFVYSKEDAKKLEEMGFTVEEKPLSLENFSNYLVSW